MDFTGLLCLLSFFITLRLMGFRFFRPTICTKCQMEETTASQELWKILNTTSDVSLQQCTDKQQDVGDSDSSSDSDSNDDNEGDDTQQQSQVPGDQSVIIEQMLNALKKNTDELSTKNITKNDVITSLT